MKRFVLLASKWFAESYLCALSHYMENDKGAGDANAIKRVNLLPCLSLMSHNLHDLEREFADPVGEYRIQLAS